MNTQNKVAIVTGASSSMGQAIAVKLAQDGIKTFLVARSAEKLEATQKAVVATGGQAEVIVGDLSNLEAINQVIESIKSKTNQVNILVNVAGIWHGKDEVYAGKDFDTFPQQIIADTLTVGAIAPTLLTHALIPLMPQDSKIINISGTFENGAKGWLPYYVSKKAIEDLTIGLAEELKDKQIQVNAISPSDTNTEAYAKFFSEYIKDSVDPQEIAKQVVYLCSEEANDITGKVFVIKKDKKPYEGFHS